MANHNPKPPDPPSNESRLNGWKEIAAHFGKGVRTVQRWEKEAGLPVRRLRTGRGEVVYAFAEELKEWGRTPGALEAGRADENASGLPAGENETSGADAGAGAVSVRLWIGVAVLVVAVVVSLVLLFRPTAPGVARQPSDWKIDARALSVVAPDGRLLWTHRFPFTLVPAEYQRLRLVGRGPVIIDDLDGDGQQEVLLIALAEQWKTESRLYCFSSDGTLRFDHTIHRSVQFGDVRYAGPWRADAVRVVTGPGGRKEIWLASNHQDYFPTLIEKLDARGRTLTEYWHSGLLTIFEPATIDGRRAMLVGGVSNEFHGAALAVLDAEHPDGTAPAVNPYFACREGCRAGSALEYLVFPATDIERLTKAMHNISDIRVDDGGGLTLVTRHNAEPLLQAPVYGEVYYMFDARLHPLHAQIEPSFTILHDELFKRGKLDHRCGPVDVAALWPVLRWDGRAFAPIRP